MELQDLSKRQIPQKFKNPARDDAVFVKVLLFQLR